MVGAEKQDTYPSPCQTFFAVVLLRTRRFLPQITNVQSRVSPHPLPAVTNLNAPRKRHANQLRTSRWTSAYVWQEWRRSLQGKPAGQNS